MHISSVKAFHSLKNLNQSQGANQRLNRINYSTTADKITFKQVAISHETLPLFPLLSHTKPVLVTKTEYIEIFDRLVKLKRDICVDLIYSYNKCLPLGQKSNYSEKEKEAIDSFFLRFAKNTEYLRMNILERTIKILKRDTRLKMNKEVLCKKAIEKTNKILLKTKPMQDLRGKAVHKILDDDERAEALKIILKLTAKLIKINIETEKFLRENLAVQNYKPKSLLQVIG